MNPASRRTVLLATDSSQSIIGEIVDGKTNAIAYSAYGERSAQKQVETRLGFNGQLREGNIGWYLLGNGYRVYNPRLMRFHSPDSWSPFGGGGLNAYMYCVGDPINRADPTGHIGFFSHLILIVAKKLDDLGVTWPNTRPMDRKSILKPTARFLANFSSNGMNRGIYHPESDGMVSSMLGAADVIVRNNNTESIRITHDIGPYHSPIQGWGKDNFSNSMLTDSPRASNLSRSPTAAQPRGGQAGGSRSASSANSAHSSNSGTSKSQTMKMEASLPIYQSQLAPPPPSYNEATRAARQIRQ